MKRQATLYTYSLTDRQVVGVITLPDEGAMMPDPEVVIWRDRVFVRVRANKPWPTWGTVTYVEGAALKINHDGVCQDPAAKCQRCGMTRADVEVAFDGYCDSNVPHSRGPQQSAIHDFEAVKPTPSAPAAPKYPPDTEYE